MATKKQTTSPTTVIPQFSEVFMERDPYDDKSYDSVDAARFKISKENVGTASLKYADGNVKILDANARVIFLYRSPVVSCSAKDKVTGDDVCYSNNTNGYASSGYLCRTECPYSDKERFKKTLKKKVYLLIQNKPGEKFELAIYRASYGTIKNLEQGLSELRKRFASTGLRSIIDGIFGISVHAPKASWDASVSLPSFNIANTELLETATGDLANAIHELWDNIKDFDERATADRLESAKRFAELKRSTEIQNKPAEEHRVAQPQPAAPAQPEASTPTPPAGPDDDDLPF